MGHEAVESDVRSDVSNEGRTGLVMLTASFSHFDPNVWSGRVLQEVFVDPADAVSHQCIRPLIGACCAPGHHGYQRACELISGQASNGPFGSPGFAGAGKTGPPSRFILSQTSAGKQDYVIAPS